MKTSWTPIYEEQQEQLPPNKPKTAKSQPHIGLIRLSIPQTRNAHKPMENSMRTKRIR